MEPPHRVTQFGNVPSRSPTKEELPDWVHPAREVITEVKQELEEPEETNFVPPQEFQEVISENNVKYEFGEERDEVIEDRDENVSMEEDQIEEECFSEVPEREEPVVKLKLVADYIFDAIEEAGRPRILTDNEQTVLNELEDIIHEMREISFGPPDDVGGAGDAGEGPPPLPLAESMKEAPQLRLHVVYRDKSYEHVLFNYGNPKFFCFKVEHRDIRHGFYLDLAKSLIMHIVDFRESVFYCGEGKTFLSMLVARHVASAQKKVFYVTSTNEQALSLLRIFRTTQKITKVGVLSKQRGPPEKNNHWVTFISLEEFVYTLKDNISLMDSVETIIFDNFDQISDPELGGIWMDLIKKLGEMENDFHFLFTSNEYMNLEDYADWFAKLRNDNIHVIHNRETRLSKGLFTEYFSTCRNVHTIRDPHDFYEGNYNTCMNEIRDLMAERSRKPATSVSMLSVALRKVVEMKAFPVIIKAKNPLEADTMLTTLGASMDLNGGGHQDEIHDTYTSHVDVLEQDVDPTSTFTRIYPFLMRGFGVLHSLLSPSAMEMTKLLYSRKLIQCLIVCDDFATRGLYRGKSVIIPYIQSKDKERSMMTNQELTDSTLFGDYGEYVFRFILLNNPLPLDEYKRMVDYQKPELTFPKTISFSSILDKLVKYGPQTTRDFQDAFFENNFLNYKTGKKAISLVSLKNDLEEKVKILREIKFKEEANEVLRLKRKKDKLLEKIHKIRMEPENVLPYLGMGRLVHIKYNNRDFGWAMIIETRSKPSEPLWKMRIFVCLRFTKTCDSLDFDDLWPVNEVEDEEFEQIEIPFEAIHALSKYRLTVPLSIRDIVEMRLLKDRLHRMIEWSDNVDLLEIETPKIVAINTEVEEVTEKITEMMEREDFVAEFEEYEEGLEAQLELENVEAELSQTANGCCYEELHKKLSILEILGYFENQRFEDGDNRMVVTSRGEIANKFLVKDEILLLEFLFSVEMFYEEKEIFAPVLIKLMGYEFDNDVRDEKFEKLHCVLKKKLKEIEDHGFKVDLLAELKRILFWECCYGQEIQSFLGREYASDELRYPLICKINALKNNFQSEFSFDFIEVDDFSFLLI